METQISCLTPPGKAAIATLGVRGPLAWPITRQLFKPRAGDLPEAAVPGKHWYGKLGIEHADDVVVAVKENGVELHCHGGVEVVRLIQELYVSRGAVVVPWTQWLGDSTTELLARAPTARTAAILLDQVNGAWQRAVARIEQGDAALRERLRELVPIGQHLVAPWKIVLAGAPNVGKSSLLNALAGFTRSVVAPTPGTTRDVVAVQLAIDGWPVEIVDTAGMRDATCDLEREGVARARNAARDADLRIWLLDGADAAVYPENDAAWMVVINKIDLPPAWDWTSMPQALQVSARTLAGLTELCDAISRRLAPSPPQAGEAVPVTPAQIDWVYR